MRRNDVQVTINDWDKVVTRLTDYVPEAQFLVHTGDQVSKFGDAGTIADFWIIWDFIRFRWHR